MPDDSHLLQAGESIARLFSRGAECREWRVGGRDMLWPGDPDVWPAVAPVLFPTCGWSRDGSIRVDGRSYPMPVHGFAAQSDFAATRLGPDEIVFSLADGAATRAHYPFAFRLEVAYRLTPDALHVGLSVANAGDTAMPYACGLHPGFAWRPAADDAFHFAAPERPEVPVIAPGGLFSERRRPVPLDGLRLPLAPSLFAAEALCFLDVRSRGFCFETREGRLEIDAPDFPHLVLWNAKGAPFLAIESWTGTGDPEGFSGSFAQRPSMILLAPGARRMHRVSYRWRPLGAASASP